MDMFDKRDNQINIKDKFSLENIKRIYKKILRSFKKYFSTNVLFLTYVFASVFIGFLLRYFTVGNVSEIKAFVCDFTIAILLGSFGYLIKPKRQFIYFFLLTVFYTFLCIINHIYYEFLSEIIRCTIPGDRYILNV